MSNTSTVQAFDKIRATLESETVNRVDEIDAILVALIARAHVFMLSKPGCGKTFLVDRLLARIAGALKFKILLSKYTTDTSIKGPKSVKAMMDDRDEHRTAGYLPEAHLGFLDEIWKTNSATANVLLDMMNERTFKNGDKVLPVPLSTVVAASNEMPDAEHDECAAIYDRFWLRLVVEPVTDPADLRRLLRLQIDPNPQPLITWDDVVVAQNEAAAIPVSDEAIDAIIEIDVRLRAEGVELSGRRVRDAQRIGQAAAWLAGDNSVQPSHLEVLRHMMWDTPAQRPVADRIVAAVTSPLLKEVIDLADEVTGWCEQLDTTLALEPHNPARTNAFAEIRTKNERSMAKALDLEDQVGGRAATALAKAMQSMEHVQRTISLEAAGVPMAGTLADWVRAKRR